MTPPVDPQIVEDEMEAALTELGRAMGELLELQQLANEKRREVRDAERRVERAKVLKQDNATTNTPHHRDGR